MGGKKKGKKGKGHGGARKGGPVDGPAEGGREDVRAAFLKETVLVDVVFIDEELQFESPQSKAELIPTSFLDDMKEVCCAMWKDSLPGLACGDLDTKAVPNIPSLGSTTFFEWSGAVRVRLKKEKLSMGLVAQMKKSSTGRLIAETELEGLKKEAQMKKSSGGRLIARTELEEMKDKMRDMMDRLVQTEARLEEGEAKHEARHIEQEKRLVTMELTLKKQVLLTNQVKRRVALERARAAVITFLNKPPHVVGKSWAEYFTGFTGKEWEMVFDGEEDLKKVKNVKNLLCWGSIIPNKDIHDLTFEDVFESIFAQEVASFQEAWIWILKLAFSKSNQEIDDAFTNLGELHG